MTIITDQIILVAFIFLWFITFILAIFANSKDDEVRRFILLGISLGLCAMCIGYSNTHATCVECDCITTDQEINQEMVNVTTCNTVLGDSEVIPNVKTAYMFSALFTVTTIVFLIYAFGDGINYFKKGKKGIKR